MQTTSNEITYSAFKELMDTICSEEMTPQMEEFYANLRKKGGWGQDPDGLYYCHPDGRKEYSKKA